MNETKKYDYFFELQKKKIQKRGEFCFLKRRMISFLGFQVFKKREKKVFFIDLFKGPSRGEKCLLYFIFIYIF